MSDLGRFYNFHRFSSGVVRCSQWCSFRGGTSGAPCWGFPSAFGSIAILSTSVDARWNGTCWSSIHGCLLLCTRLFVHIPFLFWKGLNASRKRILVHHVMVILVYGTGLLKGSMHFWGAAAGLCEFSNMFLANIELVKCCSTVHQNQIN